MMAAHLHYVSAKMMEDMKLIRTHTKGLISSTLEPVSFQSQGHLYNSILTSESMKQVPIKEYLRRLNITEVIKVKHH